MGKFVNSNGVTFSVSDDKDERYVADPAFKAAVVSEKKAPVKKTASSAKAKK